MDMYKKKKSLKGTTFHKQIWREVFKKIIIYWVIQVVYSVIFCNQRGDWQSDFVPDVSDRIVGRHWKG